MTGGNLVALVTGANKGIGFSTVKGLVQKQIFTLIGSRDLQRGQDAKDALIKQGFGSNLLDVIQIDLESQSSIDQCAQQIKQKFGGLDLLINNAGYASKGSEISEAIARKTIDINYYGTKNVINTFLPIINENGRIISVSSMAGKGTLKKMSEKKRQQFLEAKTVQEIDQLEEEFISSVAANKHSEHGFSDSTYGTSKAGLTMLTRVLANNISKLAKPGVHINCYCPGWCKTEMAGDKAPRSADQGAETAIHLATQDIKEQGKFWEDNKVSSYV